MFNVSALLLDDSIKQRNQVQLENVTFIEPDMWLQSARTWIQSITLFGVPFNRPINVYNSRQSTSWSRRSSLSGENCPSISLITPLVSGIAGLIFHKVV